MPVERRRSEVLVLEQKSAHRAKLKKWQSVGCVLALTCACVAPRQGAAQASSGNSSAAGAEPKTQTQKKQTEKTQTEKPAKAATNGPAAKTTASSRRAHPATHTTGKSTKSTTASHAGKSSHVSSRKGGKRKTARGQQKIDPARAQAIQEALIREHYLSGAAGTWNQASEDAMRHYQADHGWQSKTVPDSRALISLGLGPSNDHLLNPDSAMTTGPAPRAASLTPASHSADPGAHVNTNRNSPDAAPTTSGHDPSSPQ